MCRHTQALREIAEERHTHTLQQHFGERHVGAAKPAREFQGAKAKAWGDLQIIIGCKGVLEMSRHYPEIVAW